MLQLRRSFKARSPDWCILCRSRETIDHLFLHCSITLGLSHRIFSQAGMAWVQPNNFCNMMVIFFKCFVGILLVASLFGGSRVSLCCGLCGEKLVQQKVCFKPKQKNTPTNTKITIGSENQGIVLKKYIELLIITISL